MPRITGLQPREGESKKTGKPYKAMIVHYVENFPPRAESHGVMCDNQFVDSAIFEQALEGHSVQDALQKECTFYYSKGGFLTEMVIEWDSAE